MVRMVFWITETTNTSTLVVFSIYPCSVNRSQGHWVLHSLKCSEHVASGILLWVNYKNRWGLCMYQNYWYILPHAIHFRSSRGIGNSDSCTYCVVYWPSKDWFSVCSSRLTIKARRHFLLDKSHFVLFWSYWLSILTVESRHKRFSQEKKKEKWISIRRLEGKLIFDVSYENFKSALSSIFLS